MASETHTADAELARLAEILELTLAASEEFHSFHCELTSLVTSLAGALPAERTH